MFSEAAAVCGQALFGAQPEASHPSFGACARQAKKSIDLQAIQGLAVSGNEPAVDGGRVGPGRIDSLFFRGEQQFDLGLLIDQAADENRVAPLGADG